MVESSLLASVAQWVSTIGLPAMFLAWFRLWQEVTTLKQEIAVLKSMDLGKMGPMLTEVRIIVGELKVRQEMMALEEQRRRQTRERHE